MKILALSKQIFDRLMIEKRVTPANVEQQDRILFISINEQEDNLTPDYHPYFPEDKANVKVMYFSDVERDMEVTKLDNSGDKIMVYAMTKEQAADLYHFIKHNIKGKEAVLIHCTAGVSRSGAIASFIQDFVSGSWQLFKQDNPQIQPNAHVYRLLHDEWYKDLEFPDQTIMFEDGHRVTAMKNPDFDLNIEEVQKQYPNMKVERVEGEGYSHVEYVIETDNTNDNEVVGRWGKNLKIKVCQNK